MAGRTAVIPDQIQRIYAVGHCIPMIGALAPERLANNYRLLDQAKSFLAPSFYEDKVMPRSGIRLSDEEILGLAPDVVFMEALPGAAEQADRLSARLHAPVLLVDLNMYHYKQAFQWMGSILNEPQQAEALSDFVRRYIDPIGERAKSIPEAQRVRVYYAEGPDGLSTNPAGSSHTQVLDFVGATNVALVSNLPDEGLSSVSLEQLYLWQPHLILVWTPTAEQLITWKAIVHNPLWQPINAVKQGKVLQIPWLPFSWFDRPPSTNRILGTLWLAKTLYPDIFPLDLKDLMQSYFWLFYHKEISEAEVAYLLKLATPEVQ